MNIIIPMAGSGSRFKEKGYDLPKPLIDTKGKPMIQAVIENLNTDANYIFILQKEHCEKWKLDSLLFSIKPKCKIIKINKLTEGPACTALLAEKYLKNSELIIVNCDQIIKDYNTKYLQEFAEINNADGVIGAFISSSKKNSYVKLDSNGEIIQIEEKIVISNIATNGLHYWKKSEDFVKSAKKMIDNNHRYNNEFYIAPTYNYMVKDGKKVLPFFYNLHLPIGTPEDLEKYISFK